MLSEIVIKYAAEATLISTALAGVRRSVGLDMPRFLANRLPQGTAQNFAHKYLDVGEFCFEKGAGLFRKAAAGPEKIEPLAEKVEAATEKVAKAASKGKKKKASE
ncbi:hypothetical protein PROFUN_11753 [Planoprotostelium fungivorum]|uniref:Uncharacterized protein n=1 Tax=Planoprotostelium fungivorum TaxID=1890364 RepID=A0A2P6MYG6_9EUKA|nr:hypothetical protein PROFUN_11753 [Planoprotostelium fungivorum]